jgi:hypothetical protein
VASSKLLKKIQKELKASPAKTAALGVGLLLAAIFWAPLVSKWLKAKNGPAMASTSVPDAGVKATLASVTPTPLMMPNTQALATPNSLADWLKTMETRKGDLLASSVRWPEEMRSPFVRTRSLAEYHQREQLAEDRAAKEKAAQDDQSTNEEPAFELPAGWTLSATTFGTKRKLAQIDGRIYREGETLQTAEGATVVVKWIEPRRVVLEQGQRTFELFIPQVATQ